MKMRAVLPIAALSLLPAGTWGPRPAAWGLTGRPAFAAPLAEALADPPPQSCRRRCDVDGDGDVDLLDVLRTVEAEGTPATGPDDRRDADPDGWIDGADAARCWQACTLPGCDVPPVDHRPVADAGPDQSVPPGSAVTLDGSGSSDPDGAPLRYRWKLVGRPPGSAARLADRWAVRPGFVADLAGEYVARLVVDDCRKRSVPDEVTVVTAPGNVPPVADAGADQTVPRGALVQLDGSSSSDGNGDPLGFAWSIVAMPAGSGAALDDPAAAVPAFVADLPGDYVVELVVDDGQAASAPDEVRISTVNSAPVADAGTDQRVAAAATVTLDGSGSTDADGDPLTFRWALLAQPAGSAAALTDPTSPAPSFTADLPGDYVVQLVVGDGFAESAPDTVLVTAVEPATVTVTAADAEAAEAGGDPGLFTIARSGTAAGELTVSYSLAGSAANGADYQPLAGSVTLAAGAAAADVTVTPTDDVEVEGVEVVTLILSAGAGYTVGVPGSASVRIADDDLPVVTATATDPEATEAGPTPGTVTLSRTGDPTAALTVIVARGGTAGGGDYAGAGGGNVLVTIPAGQPTADLTITPLADNLVEPAETVILTVQPAGEYTVGGAASATVTIVDDPPVVALTAPDADAAEAGADPGVFAVTRSGGALAAPLTVPVAVAGTAANAADYPFLGGSVAIPAGQAAAAVVVTPLADNRVEGPETVVLTILAHASYVIGSSDTATVTIADDPAVVTVEATDAEASEAGLDPGQLTVTRRGGDLGALLQVIVARGGTAANGLDYASLGGASFIVDLPAGAPSATVTIAPLQDALVEGDETVVLTIQPRAAYVVGSPGAATVTLADDD